MTYLYTLTDCAACAKLKESLGEYQEVPIDNPLLQYGVQMLFKDGKVHAPVVVRGGDILITSPSQPEQLFRIGSISLQ